MKSTENRNRNLITALYCRLSQEDERLGESLSIENQRLMLQRYAEEHRFPNIQFYVDDGFSGADFNRPSFKRMMTDVECGKVGIVIVKDQSRLPNCCGCLSAGLRCTRSWKNILAQQEIQLLSIMRSSCPNKTVFPPSKSSHALRQRLLKKQSPESTIPSGDILHTFSLNDISLIAADFFAVLFGVILQAQSASELRRHHRLRKPCPWCMRQRDSFYRPKFSKDWSD